GLKIKKRGSRPLLGRLVEFDVEAERAQLLDQHVEGFGNARLEGVVAADDRLVDLGAARHVVRLHGQDLLQRVGGAVGLEGPHLHLAEALAPNCALPPSGCWVTSEYGPIERAWILSSTRWCSFSM